VNPKIQSTVDAAALSKMSERGQIRGGIVDGPLAMDNAVSLSAAKTKGLTSLVAGRADILVAPNLRRAISLRRTLPMSRRRRAQVWCWAPRSGVVDQPGDDERSRLFSCAVAVLYAHWLSTGESASLRKP